MGVIFPDSLLSTRKSLQADLKFLLVSLASKE